MVIILNGASSSGKTTIANALKHLSAEPFLHAGIDFLYSMMPPDYINHGKFAEQGFLLTTENSLATVKFGSYGRQVRSCSADLASVFAAKDLNILVDEVLVGDEFLQDYVKKFKHAQAYFVGIYCELKVLQEREKFRGDRGAGLAESQYKLVHEPARFYDLELDSTHTSSLENAKKILDFVQKNPEPKSLKLCAQRMGL